MCVVDVMINGDHFALLKSVEILKIQRQDFSKVVYPTYKGYPYNMVSSYFSQRELITNGEVILVFK